MLKMMPGAERGTVLLSCACGRQWKSGAAEPKYVCPGCGGVIAVVAGRTYVGAKASDLDMAALIGYRPPGVG